MYGALSEDGTASASFYDCDVAAPCSSPGGSTTAAMQAAALYTAAGWDFTTVWGFAGSGMHPCLRWEPACGP